MYTPCFITIFLIFQFSWLGYSEADDLVTLFRKFLDLVSIPTSSPSPSQFPSQIAANGTTRATYCPSKDDFMMTYGGSNVTIQDGGWTIAGDGGVATKSSFNLIEGVVEYDVDVSQVPDGVNANIYTISPKFANTAFNYDSDYCDGAVATKRFCVEMDWLESNGACGAATTQHNIKGMDVKGCNSAGCASTYVYNNQPKFHMKIAYDKSGIVTVSHHNTTITTYNPPPGPLDVSTLLNAYTQFGAVIYSSQWVGWVPLDKGPCKGNRNSTDGSTYTISNLRITGSVLQGPTPKLC